MEVEVEESIGIDGLVVEEDIEVATGHDGQWKVRGGSHLLLLRCILYRGGRDSYENSRDGYEGGGGMDREGYDLGER